MRALGIAAVVSIVLATSALAQYGDDSCQRARESYNFAVSEVADKLRRYQRCAAASAGNDDCSLEFRRLKRAHDDFEMAVSQIANDC